MVEGADRWRAARTESGALEGRARGGRGGSTHQTRRTKTLKIPKCRIVQQIMCGPNQDINRFQTSAAQARDVAGDR